MCATMAGDRGAMANAGVAIGYFDFGSTDMVPRLREASMALGLDRDFWHIPPHRRLVFAPQTRWFVSAGGPA